MHCISMIRVTALGVAFLAGGAANHDREAARAGATGVCKIGVIDLQTAIGSTAEGKQTLEELQSYFALPQSELNAINKQIDDLRHRLEGGQTLGQVEELQQVKQQGQHLVAQRDLKNKELNEDLQSAQAEVADRIGSKMMGLLERYSRENGYVVILNNSSSGRDSQIVYIAKNIDVTQDIIRLYDQAYPMKTEVPATEPESSKQ